MHDLAVTPELLRARDPAARAAEACALDVALELPHAQLSTLLAHAPARLATLQAVGLRDAHAFRADESLRARGIAHVLDALELAARARIPRVLTVCGFGAAERARAFEHSLAQFRAVRARARELGVRVVIERLGAARSDAMLGADEHARLHAELAAPDVFGSALDTGHMLDAGEDPLRVLESWPLALDELQVRGRAGSVPTLDAPFDAWARALRFPARVVCVESRSEPPPTHELCALLARLREAFGRDAASASSTSNTSTTSHRADASSDPRDARGTSEPDTAPEPR